MDSLTLEYESKVGQGFDFIKLANALVEPDEPEMEIPQCLRCSKLFESEAGYSEHLEEEFSLQQ